MTQEIEKIWPEWKVVERIGSGAYGSVYKAVRSDHNLTSSAAIKVISIPKDASEMESLRSDGMTRTAPAPTCRASWMTSSTRSSSWRP